MSAGQSGISAVNGFAQLLTVIVIFIFVLFCTYVATKYTADFKRMQGFNSAFEVIDSISVGNGGFLELIRVGENYIVISVTKDNITKIMDLTEEEVLKIKDNKKTSKISFSSLMFKAKSEIEKKGDHNE